MSIPGGMIRHANAFVWILLSARCTPPWLYIFPLWNHFYACTLTCWEHHFFLFCPLWMTTLDAISVVDFLSSLMNWILCLVQSFIDSADLVCVVQCSTIFLFFLHGILCNSRRWIQEILHWHRFCKVSSVFPTCSVANKLKKRQHWFGIVFS
jgi:hypothetical protein